KIAAYDDLSVRLNDDTLHRTGRNTSRNKGTIQHSIAFQPGDTAARVIVEGSEVAGHDNFAVRRLSDAVDGRVGTQAREKAGIERAIGAKTPNTSDGRRESAPDEQLALS